MGKPKKGKNFVRDLQLGSKGEEFVKEIFSKHNLLCSSEKTKDERQFWDLYIESLDLKFEIKYDLYCERSGNIAIEFYNPKAGKPSGVGATKADFWIHIVTNPLSAWLTPVEELKKFCETIKPHKTVTSGGDDNSSMHLYVKEVIFQAIFKRIDELATKEIMEVLNKWKLKQSW